jgi:hypothetical protein
MYFQYPILHDQVFKRFTHSCPVGGMDIVVHIPAKDPAVGEFTNQVATYAAPKLPTKISRELYQIFIKLLPGNFGYAIVKFLAEMPGCFNIPASFRL